MSSKHRTLIWLKPRFLGDAVMATPLINAVAASFTNTAVLVSPHVRELLAAEPKIRLLDAGASRGASSVFREARRLRKQRFSTVLLVNRSFRSAVVVWLARIPQRIGHDTEGRGLLLTTRVSYDTGRFESECYGDLGRAIGVQGDYSMPRLSLFPSEKNAAKLLGPNTVGVQPGSTDSRKMLPTTVVCEVVEYLLDEGHQVAILGAASEMAAAVPVLKAFRDRLTDLVGKCTLRESMAAIKNLEVLVAGDTGLVHIAAALGTPSVAAFGPTPVDKWGYKRPTAVSILAPDQNMEKLSSIPVIEAISQIHSA